MTASIVVPTPSTAAAESWAVGASEVLDGEPRETLLQQFNRYFDTVPADTPERVMQAQRIRYQVYCLERGFESSDEHPDGLENDEFDVRAEHRLLIHLGSGEAVGTVRLVLPDRDAPNRSFAIQHVTDHPVLHDPLKFPLGSMAEVSRFSISKQFRRRRDDTFYGESEARPPSAEQLDRRSGPLMRLGLIQATVRLSAENGVTHWCAVMEPTLLRMLAATSINFEPIGPLVDYHGRRQPCYCNVATVLSCVKNEQPDVWNILTDGGKLWQPIIEAQAALNR